MGRSSGGWTGSYRITGPFLQRTPVHGGTRWLKPDFPGGVRVPGGRYGAHVPDLQNERAGLMSKPAPMPMKQMVHP